jgi:hypothetical protein
MMLQYAQACSLQRSCNSDTWCITTSDKRSHSHTSQIFLPFDKFVPGPDWISALLQAGLPFDALSICPFSFYRPQKCQSFLSRLVRYSIDSLRYSIGHVDILSPRRRRDSFFRPIAPDEPKLSHFERHISATFFGRPVEFFKPSTLETTVLRLDKKLYPNQLFGSGKGFYTCTQSVY